MTSKFIEKFIMDAKKPYNTDLLVDEFYKRLEVLSIEEITDIILSDIYIPDYYKHDSSEETLFTKLVEVLTSFVFNKIGIKCEYLKTKSATEDIHLEINDGNSIKHIVGDVKTYRLGRSQGAPNVKDFVKPADFKEIWGSKYDSSYGLVVFPSTHEWKQKSDVYQHCTTPTYPIIMMHYSHLAILLNSIDSREDIAFSSLWDYSDLEMGQINNKSKQNYWDIFNIKFNRLFKVDTVNLAEKYEKQIRNNIKIIIGEYEERKITQIQTIKEELESYDYNQLKDKAYELMTEKIIDKIDSDISRIKKYRL